MAKTNELQFAGETMTAGFQGMSEVSRGVQAIGMEVADYTRRSIAENTETLEQLLSARSVEHALEIQSTAARTAYDSYMAQASKLGNMYAELARDAMKPFETMLHAR